MALRPISVPDGLFWLFIMASFTLILYWIAVNPPPPPGDES